jgi:outer membrane protein
MKALLPLFIVAALGAVAAPAAQAESSDNWVVRFGAHVVDPKSNNGTLAGAKATVDSSVRPSASLEYMITPNLGVDLLAAWPFEHDVKLLGLGKVAQTKQLPPTVGLNYHFMPNNSWSPFLGLGLNYTNFFDTKGAGALNGASVSIENSWGDRRPRGRRLQYQSQVAHHGRRSLDQHQERRQGGWRQGRYRRHQPDGLRPQRGLPLLTARV